MLVCLSPRVLGISACAVCALWGTAPALAQDGCVAQAAQEWSAAGRALTLSAHADGPTCADAVATLVIRDASGAPLWAHAFVTSWNFQLRDAATPAEMQAALQEWLDSAVSWAATTSTLPQWPEGADRPDGGEFPFYPSEAYSYRDNYMSLRADDVPFLCVVSGSESAWCIAFHPDWADDIGIQSFPG